MSLTDGYDIPGNRPCGCSFVQPTAREILTRSYRRKYHEIPSNSIGNTAVTHLLLFFLLLFIKANTPDLPLVIEKTLPTGQWPVASSRICRNERLCFAIAMMAMFNYYRVGRIESAILCHYEFGFPLWNGWPTSVIFSLWNIWYPSSDRSVWSISSSTRTGGIQLCPFYIVFVVSRGLPVKQACTYAHV